jgi:hypothetical protein
MKSCVICHTQEIYKTTPDSRRTLFFVPGQFITHYRLDFPTYEPGQYPQWSEPGIDVVPVGQHAPQVFGGQKHPLQHGAYK